MPQPIGIDEELATIAKMMGFPPEAWFEDVPGDGIQTAPTEGRSMASHVRASGRREPPLAVAESRVAPQVYETHLVKDNPPP